MRRLRRSFSRTTATGIAAADLPHIFERFYRGDHSRTRATGGSGLGLAIAKALVEAYGGSIRADSAPGKGTRMTVEFPASLEFAPKHSLQNNDARRSLE